MEKSIDRKNILKRILNTVKNVISLHEENRLDFYMITTKVLLGFLFFDNLYRIFYGITFFGLKLPFDVTETKTFVQLIIVCVFIATSLSYLFFAYERKSKIANTIFKVQTILAIVTFLLFLIIYLGDNDGTKSLGIGFFIDLVLIAGMVIFCWFDRIFKNLFMMLFKKELIAINQYPDKESIKDETLNPETASEPEPAPEPEIIEEKTSEEKE